MPGREEVEGVLGSRGGWGRRAEVKKGVVGSKVLGVLGRC